MEKVGFIRGSTESSYRTIKLLPAEKAADVSRIVSPVEWLDLTCAGYIQSLRQSEKRR